jgi:membrane protease YdiL (CAAX protease family)
MTPLIWLMSTARDFQARYPFYPVQPGEGLSTNLLLWEGAYLIQFVAVEFLFRGFMLHGTKHRFGYYAVFVMAIPYCMIHFAKPLPEALAAIVSAVVLGTLSLKSRSIWLGVVIHYSVAGGMDFAALWQKHLL